MKLIKLNAIASTNDYLKAFRKNVALEDGTVVSTTHQLNGRGQAAAKWYSEASKSLCFSMFKKLSGVGVAGQIALNWAVSLGVKNGLENCGMNDISVKWPNDILADGRKICGILIENQWKAGSMTSSIIGVGINVNNQSLPHLPQASSMSLLTGIQFDISEVLFAVVAGITSELDRLTAKDIAGLKADYEQHLFRINIASEFEDEQGSLIRGTIKGVSNAGLLQVAIANGVSKEFQMKELKLRY